MISPMSRTSIYALTSLLLYDSGMTSDSHGGDCQQSFLTINELVTSSAVKKNPLKTAAVR